MSVAQATGGGDDSGMDTAQDEEEEEEGENSEQTEEERREIRKKYRELLEETGAESDMTVGKLNLKLLEANNLFQNVHTTRERALDARFMVQAADIALRRAQAITTSRVKFNVVEFAELAAKSMSKSTGVDGSPVVTVEDWREFGKNISTVFKKAPPYQFMFGAFERKPQPKVAKLRKPKEKEVAGCAPVAPENVTEMGKSDQELTTEEVERVLRILRENYKAQGDQPICFYEFAVDPHSFSRTMENIFHISFLVRDGYAVIYTDDEDLPAIEPLLGGAAEADERDFAKQQIVISMTPAEHREIVKSFKIEIATIPPPKGSTGPPKTKE